MALVFQHTLIGVCSWGSIGRYQLGDINWLFDVFDSQILLNIVSLNVIERQESSLFIFMLLTDSQETLVRRKTHCCYFFDLVTLLDEHHLVCLDVSHSNVLAYKLIYFLWDNCITNGVENVLVFTILNKYEGISYFIILGGEISSKRIPIIIELISDIFKGYWGNTRNQVWLYSVGFHHFSLLFKLL